jgi:hypothetical protein
MHGGSCFALLLSCEGKLESLASKLQTLDSSLLQLCCAAKQMQLDPEEEGIFLLPRYICRYSDVK